MLNTLTSVKTSEDSWGYVAGVVTVHIHKCKWDGQAHFKHKNCSYEVRVSVQIKIKPLLPVFADVNCVLIVLDIIITETGEEKFAEVIEYI